MRRVGLLGIGGRGIKKGGGKISGGGAEERKVTGIGRKVYEEREER